MSEAFDFYDKNAIGSFLLPLRSCMGRLRSDVDGDQF